MAQKWYNIAVERRCHMKRDENQTVEYKESWHEKYLPIVADMFNRLDYAERRGSGIGKILDAYALPLSNPCGRKPSFVSDTFFRTILPNLTYGLTKEELVAFAENGRAPSSHTPNSCAPQVDPTSRPRKSTPQVDPTSRERIVANSESRAKLIASLLAEGSLSRQELMLQMGLRDRKSFYMLYVLPSLDLGLIEYTIPNKPNSRLQKYRLTAKGRSAVAHERRKD